MTLIGTTTPSQNEPGSKGNEGWFHIPESSTTGASPSGALVSYPEYALRRGSYPSPEMQSVYSTASADRGAIRGR